MSGEYDDAISRLDDLIDTVPFISICYVVQARAQRATTRRISPLTLLAGVQYLLLGNSRMESCDYEGAIRSFGRARAQMQPHASPALSVVSLVS